MSRERMSTCAGCKNIRLCQGGKCATCRGVRDQVRNRVRQRTREQPWYDAEWRRISSEAREQHLALYGPHCPACDRMVEPKDLTVDHVKPRSLDEGVRVICRSCNSSKGSRGTT